MTPSIRRSAKQPALSDLSAAETGIERRFKILKLQPWIGVRVWNALNSFLPTDVQSHIGSPRSDRSTTPNIDSFRIHCVSSE